MTAIRILRLRFNSPPKVPECSVCVALKEYTVFNNVENFLNLAVTREHLDVLPNQGLRDVVKYQYMCRTTLYALSIAMGKRYVGVDHPPTIGRVAPCMKRGSPGFEGGGRKFGGAIDVDRCLFAVTRGEGEGLWVCRVVVLF